MINELPTIFEVVTGVKQQRDMSGNHNNNNNNNNNNNKSKSSGKMVRGKQFYGITFSLLPAFYHYLYLLNFCLLGCFKQSRLPETPTKGVKVSPPPKEEDDSGDEEAEDDEQGAICGACGDNYAHDEFWICCDVCEKWFHGKCVKITPAKAEHIKQYKCPGCSNKRARV